MAARRYLTIHPGTKEAALAQNIVATAYYDRINDASRDQADTKKARWSNWKRWSTAIPTAAMPRTPRSAYAWPATCSPPPR